MYTLISQYQYCLIQSYYSTSYSLIQFWKPGKCISSITLSYHLTTCKYSNWHWKKNSLKHPTHFSMATHVSQLSLSLRCTVTLPHSQAEWEWARVLHGLVLFLTHWLSKWVLISVECTALVHHSCHVWWPLPLWRYCLHTHYHNKLCSSPSLH